MLVTIDSLLSGGELAEVRRLLAAAPWQSGRVTAGPQAALAKNNQQLV
jgi:PKHD-type hydroxylase